MNAKEKILVILMDIIFVTMIIMFVYFIINLKRVENKVDETNNCIKINHSIYCDTGERI